MFNRNCRSPFMNNMFSQDGSIDITNNTGNIDIDFDQTGYNAMNNNVAGDMSSTSAPVMEPMRERVVNRTIEHVVPHVCPIRTRIINHHVFRHTYSPNYTCCEENVCEHVNCGSCCNF